MHYTKLGTTDLLVSRVCMGTMVWGNGYKGTEQEIYEQLDAAVDHGITFLDTAELYPIPPTASTYGKTEEIIGNWLEKRKNRSHLVIATKVVGPHSFSWLQREKPFGKQALQEALEGSLRRLKTDYIDLYQLHRPARPVPLWGKLTYDVHAWNAENRYEEDILETLRALQELQQAGKIRYIGVSNETPWGVMKFLSLSERYNLPRIQAIQNAYNLLRREYEAGLAEISLHEKVGLLAYSPLAGGILTGKYQGGKIPKGSRYATRGKKRMPQYLFTRCLEATDRYVALAKEVNITPTHLALAWVYSRPFVTSVIIGTTDKEQLLECLGFLHTPLHEDVCKKIDRIFSDYPNPACW